MTYFLHHVVKFVPFERFFVYQTLNGVDSKEVGSYLDFFWMIKVGLISIFCTSSPNKQTTVKLALKKM